MFGASDVTRALGVKPAATSEMQSRMKLWSDMYAGDAPWVTDYVKSLRLEAGLVREFANITVGEMSSSISVPALDALYQNAIRRLSQRMQAGLASGAMIIKPLPDGNVQYIPQNAFIPIRYDAAGRLVEVIFPETIREDDRFYTRLEWHKLDASGLTVINRAYISRNADTLGLEMPLTARDEWAAILPEVRYAGVTRPVFGYFVTPIDNTIDGSFAGVSVFDAAIEKIRKADEQDARLKWEFESGERAIHVDDIALRVRKDKDGKPEQSTAKLNRRLYRGLNLSPGEGKDLFSEFSPEFRDASIINGMEEYKREIEFTQIPTRSKRRRQRSAPPSSASSTPFPLFRPIFATASTISSSRWHFTPRKRCRGMSLSATSRIPSSATRMRRGRMTSAWLAWA